ncbi:D-Ala-D-Ala carboxypeptidase family metallohydrolase [Algivirga pacifica]
MHQDTLAKLDAMRTIAGFPFVLTSTYRDKEYNKKVGGAPNSSHTRGRAVDIRISSSAERYKAVQAALFAGFTRIGIAEEFVHVDDDPSLPQAVIFTY